MLHLTRVLFMTAVLLLSTAMFSDKPALPQPQKRAPDVVYVGTPYDVVSKMLRLAGVKKQDVVYDLGCGDGRMVVLAAQKYGCRATGYDIDPERVAAALVNVKRNKVVDLVNIAQRDIFEVDFSDADVLLIYLRADLFEMLLPQFEKLKPGSRLVSHNYALPGFQADAALRVISHEDNVSHTIFMYTIPLRPASDGHPAP
jgi:SAM-dependent methyltransferase